MCDEDIVSSETLPHRSLHSQEIIYDLAAVKSGVDGIPPDFSSPWRILFGVNNTLHRSVGHLSCNSRYAVSSSQFHRVVAFPPGINSSQQGAHTSETFALEQMRHAGAADFVWARAIDDDIAVVWEFVPTLLDLVQDEV